VRSVGFHRIVAVALLPLFAVASVFCTCLQTALAQIPHHAVHAHTTASCCGGSDATDHRQGSPSPDVPTQHCPHCTGQNLSGLETLKSGVPELTQALPLAACENPIALIVAAPADHRAAVATESPPAIASPSLLGLHCALVI
jgi:hypothetical protein